MKRRIQIALIKLIAWLTGEKYVSPVEAEIVAGFLNYCEELTSPIPNGEGKTPGMRFEVRKIAMVQEMAPTVRKILGIE